MMGFLKGKKRKGLSDLVGVDFSASGVKVVRIKNNRDGICVTGVDLLPAVDFTQPARRISLPRNLCPHYSCLSYSSKDTVVRLVSASIPSESEELSEEEVRELLNVNEDYRAAATLLKRGKGREDSSFLAAAMPESDARFLISMFPSGPPAPMSIEISGLSTINAFLHARGNECIDTSVCLIECGDKVSYFAFLNRGVVSLVGKFIFGGDLLRRKIVEDLGVDDELASSILSDRSVNIAAIIQDVMTPFLKQLVISRDFVERHQKSRITRIYASGGTSLFPHWKETIQQSLLIDVVSWSPFENIDMEPGIFPPNLKGQETRFSAAVGAVIGGFQE